jgi:hypothetical protein
VYGYSRLIHRTPIFSVEEAKNMLARIGFAGMLGFAALCTGCTLPCHPYDYRGPVYDCNGQYCSNVRAGSILTEGGPQSFTPVEDQEVISEAAADVRQAAPEVGEAEGARKIISVTDRKVGESAQKLANTHDEGDQSMPILAQPASSKLRWR